MPVPLVRHSTHASYRAGAHTSTTCFGAGERGLRRAPEGEVDRRLLLTGVFLRSDSKSSTVIVIAGFSGDLGTAGLRFPTRERPRLLAASAAVGVAAVAFRHALGSIEMARP